MAGLSVLMLSGGREFGGGREMIIGKQRENAIDGEKKATQMKR